MKQGNKNTVRHFKTISDMHRELGLPKVLHPLISILDYSEVKITREMLAENFVMEFYNITYNESPGCSMKYGQTTYDFNEGGMLFTSPGQFLAGIKSMDSTAGFTLLIHPDFLRTYPLAARMKNYGFFSYAVTESLYLSDKEKNIIKTIANIIKDELKTTIDDLSQDVLVSQIELLLNYSQRFYKRQFITRKTLNHDILTKLEEILNRYFEQEEPLQNGLPTVEFLAGKLNFSPRYLSDMLRAFTGQNAQQLIHAKVIERAKEKLTSTDLTVSEVAYELGFGHSQSFNKLFKAKTNQTPLEFRASFN
ncbi:helix-turn-helix domain-containing protein [Zhouia sp. PK063]|uniref:helix-turn-helix domain-containing protein n=1 Tax=Zhouia sp. PK063 TaxID=3373602 RepID=UPI0037BCADC5